jgi:hypothetical protein
MQAAYTPFYAVVAFRGNAAYSVNAIVSMLQTGSLGGLVVECMPLDPRFAGSNLAEDDGFLKAIKFRSTTSFGEEVKPSVPCKSLRHVEEPYEYERDTSYAKYSGHFSPGSSCFATTFICW